MGQIKFQIIIKNKKLIFESPEMSQGPEIQDNTQSKTFCNTIPTHTIAMITDTGDNPIVYIFEWCKKY